MLSLDFVVLVSLTLPLLTAAHTPLTRFQTASNARLTEFTCSLELELTVPL